jgi:hypothetical protein
MAWLLNRNKRLLFFIAKIILKSVEPALTGRGRVNMQFEAQGLFFPCPPKALISVIITL